MGQDFKINMKGEKMNQESYVINQSVIKVTEDVLFMNRYKHPFGGDNILLIKVQILV